MLTEDFEIHAVCVESLVIVRAVVDGPDVLVPQGPKPCAREGTAPRDVPGRLERLQTPHCGHVTRLRGLLLLDRPEAVPEALGREGGGDDSRHEHGDRKSTRLNSSHVRISYAVFCLKKKTYKYSSLHISKKKKTIRRNKK